MTSATTPAILGGSPVRSTPYPTANTIGEMERRLVNQVLDTGVLSGYIAHHGAAFNGGPMVAAFEEEMCRTFGNEYAVSCNSATSGLQMSVAAALAGLGDEVIVPPYTMSATASVVAATNATPIFADIRPDTFCIDPDDVRRKLSSRTRAIIAVNLFGGPADLLTLRQLADERQIMLIEDNAQAPGGRIGARNTGTVGHMAVFSFNCHKTMQCGEGGVVVTDDAVLADRLRLVRNHGDVVLSQRPEVPDELHGLIGFNFRLTELQSAVALAQLRRLEELTVGRIDVADALTAGLRGVEGLTPPWRAPENRHVYYLYAMRVDSGRLGLSRAQLKTALDAERVPVAEGYVRPIYLHPMFHERVAHRRTGFGAGIWHPAPDSPARYRPGLCPVTEQMHFQEVLTTNICRADLTIGAASDFVRAVEKVVSHRTEVRAALEARGVH